MTTACAHDKDPQKVSDPSKGNRIAALTTTAPDGEPTSRPAAPQRAGIEGGS